MGGGDLSALWVAALAKALGVNPIVFGLLCLNTGLLLAILVVVAVRR